jgi:hypothetical protein
MGGKGGWGQGGEMTQALYAHMNNKRKKKKWPTGCSKLLHLKNICTCHLYRREDKGVFHGRKEVMDVRYLAVV